MPSRWFANKSMCLILLAVVCPLYAQVNTGELRLRVTDSAGFGLKASVTLSSGASQYRNVFDTSAAGDVDVKALPYGIYMVRAEKPGFAPHTGTVEVRSLVPTVHAIMLAVASVATSVDV